jgi:GNAT superfamily N-acetyltransferase
MIAVAPATPAERRAIARLYADALVDDPGWVSVGPDSARRRRAFVRRICGGEAWAAPRVGGQVRVTRDDGVPSAAMISFGPDARPASALFTVTGFPGAILAGPTSVIRGLRAEAQLNGGHPDEPHVYVSLLAADPSHQRGGRGRALLTAAIEEAEALDVPITLDTANPANLPYYHGFGFRTTGEVTLPRGAPLWYLRRG